LSEVYEAIIGEKVEVIGKVYELFKCPCCNRNTLSESYDLEKGTGYDICDYCNWEDDGKKLTPSAVLIRVRYLNIEVGFKKIPTFTIKMVIERDIKPLLNTDAKAEFCLYWKMSKNSNDKRK